MHFFEIEVTQRHRPDIKSVSLFTASYCSNSMIETFHTPQMTVTQKHRPRSVYKKNKEIAYYRIFCPKHSDTLLKMSDTLCAAYRGRNFLEIA